MFDSLTISVVVITYRLSMPYSNSNDATNIWPQAPSRWIMNPGTNPLSPDARKCNLNPTKEHISSLVLLLPSVSVQAGATFQNLRPASSTVATFFHHGCSVRFPDLDFSVVARRCENAGVRWMPRDAVDTAGMRIECFDELPARAPDVYSRI